MSNIIFPKVVEMVRAKAEGRYITAEMTDNDFRVGEIIQFELPSALIIAKIVDKRERLVKMQVIETFEKGSIN